MTALQLSNSLTVLADDVRAAMNISASAEKTSIAAAIEAGRLLTEAKAACAHGEWLAFLKRTGVQERSAQRYMKLSWSGLKSDTVSDLGGIKATLRWLDGFREPAPGEYLMVSLDDFAAGARKSPLIVAWLDGESGTRFAVFNPQPNDTWVDLLVRPLERTERLLPAICEALNHRCSEMSFQIVTRDDERQVMIEDPRWLAAVAEAERRSVQAIP